MGGTTSVTLRKPSGDEFRMTRWTNSMPWGICNAKMFNSDEKHIDKYLSQWLEMKRDYEKNHFGGNFEFEMTDCYFPSAGLTPCGYGLTVVDHVNKVILDMQGYCSFDDMTVAGIGLEINKTDKGYEADVDPESSFSRMLEFIEEGRLLGVTTRKSYEEKRPYDEIESFELEYLVPKIYGAVTKDWYQFVIDTKPFTIERFSEYEPEALRDMRKRVLDLGFILTDEEEKGWEEVIKEAVEEYGEDEDD